MTNEQPNQTVPDNSQEQWYDDRAELTCNRDFYPWYFAGLKCWIRRPDGGLF